MAPAPSGPTSDLAAEFSGHVDISVSFSRRRDADAADKGIRDRRAVARGSDMARDRL